MDRVVFHLSTKSRIGIAIFVAGLLVFVWLHWQGQRQTELVIFSVLSALAATLFTLKGDVSLDLASRELTARRFWIGWPLIKTVVRVPSNGELLLDEDVTNRQRGQGIIVEHILLASGELRSKDTAEPGPYTLVREVSVKNRIALEKFAEEASGALDVPLQDTRRYTEALRK